MTQVDQTSWEANFRLIHMLCRTALGKARALGLMLEYEDMFQECSIVWMKARKSFDPTKGFKFTTYLGSAVARHLASMVGEEVFHNARTVRGLAAEETFLRRAELDEDDPVIGEVMAQDLFDKGIAKLSPVSRMVMRLMTNPPPEIMEELRAYQAKARYARDCGINRTAPEDLSLAFVLNYILPMHVKMTTTRELAVRDELSREVRL